MAGRRTLRCGHHAVLLPKVMSFTFVLLLLTGNVRPGGDHPVIAQPDVCAVIDQAITRLGDDVGDPAEVAEASKVAAALDHSRSIAFKQQGLRFRGPWGRCRVTSPPGSFFRMVEQVRFSEDGSFAVVSGGWIAAELLGSGGECYFRKTASGWAIIGCANTWAV